MMVECDDWLCVEGDVKCVWGKMCEVMCGRWRCCVNWFDEELSFCVIWFWFDFDLIDLMWCDVGDGMRCVNVCEWCVMDVRDDWGERCVWMVCCCGESDDVEGRRRRERRRGNVEDANVGGENVCCEWRVWWWRWCEWWGRCGEGVWDVWFECVVCLRRGVGGGGGERGGVRRARGCVCCCFWYCGVDGDVVWRGDIGCDVFVGDFWWYVCGVLWRVRRAMESVDVWFGDAFGCCGGDWFEFGDFWYCFGVESDFEVDDVSVGYFVCVDGGVVVGCIRRRVAFVSYVDEAYEIDDIVGLFVLWFVGCCCWYCGVGMCF